MAIAARTDAAAPRCDIVLAAELRRLPLTISSRDLNAPDMAQWWRLPQRSHMTVASPRSPLFARAPFWVVVAGVTLCVGVALGLTVPDFTSGRWVGAQWEAVPRSVSPLPLRGAGAVLPPSQ